MVTAKIAITINENTLNRLDQFINDEKIPSRSKAIQQAVEEKLERIKRERLGRECAKLDPKIEKSMAEEGIAEESQLWPEY